MHVSRLRYKALQQAMCCGNGVQPLACVRIVSLSSPGTIEPRLSSPVCDWIDDAYAFGAAATAEITNTPNSAIARIIAILIVITGEIVLLLIYTF